MHRGLRIGSSSLDSNTFNLMKSGAYEGKIAGLYDLEETLGRGHFAVVKLARHVFTGEKVAVKVIDKSKLDEISKAHLFQEVRCMKLVQHPNVVRLYEVIDTATKLYLILELGDGGDLYDYIMRHDTGLSEQLAKEYFRQIVRAISYCHQLHVVHRDLKPENVVFFEKLGVVKLTDFGFSNKFCPGQKLETSCGSLAYSAPEILLGDSYDAPAVDVWSLGVILYMLVCGQAPFQEANDSETLTMIMDCKYSVPPHVSKECRDLIARMLVRNPDKRATLTEIANHPWLAIGKHDNYPVDVIPLVSKEQLSEDDHNFIVQKIVNGKIATKEEIQECLDKNEYNHITATYFLLAERKLRSKRQDQIVKNKRPEHLAVTHNTQVPKIRENNGTGPSPCLLSVPRTPGDVPQRTRKCSIVQEDEEEEDISNSISSREELAPPLNRRGSRSEGRLNLALQERLAESERRKPEKIMIEPQPQKLRLDNNNKSKPMGKSASLADSISNNKDKNNLITTTVITESSTITIPIVTSSPLPCNSIPKYKTMPSPTRNLLITTTPSPLQLNEIFEEGDTDPTKTRQLVNRTQHRTSYEQRRSKFHKTRTASCSSSDASDDDSEKRKKRAHKLNNTSAKPLQGRRDSHDDSSDSQEPGTGGSGVGNTGSNALIASNNTNVNNTQNTTEQQQKGGNNNNDNSNGGRKNTNGAIILCRRHKTATRRRHGETRLRESQSLNRITEVQEDGLVISTTTTDLQPKSKSIGARLLQGFNTIKNKNINNNQEDKLVTHMSRKDTISTTTTTTTVTTPSSAAAAETTIIDEKDNMNKLVAVDKGALKKMRLLGKYFQVPKKLCIPLPGLFTRNRLYKAQSCSSLNRDKIYNKDKLLGKQRQRAVSVVRNSEGDINQNNKEKHKNSTVVQLNNVCNELTGICAIHFGQASKCCSSFC